MKDNHGKLTTFHRRDVKPIDMDIKIAEFFEEERQNFKTRDANHIMPRTKIPDLAWDDWTPATVNDQDKLAVAKKQVENLECHCTECSPEIEEINTVVEISEIITPPVQKNHQKHHITPTNGTPSPVSIETFFPTALRKIKKYMYFYTGTLGRPQSLRSSPNRVHKFPFLDPQKTIN